MTSLSTSHFRSVVMALLLFCGELMSPNHAIIIFFFSFLNCNRKQTNKNHHLDFVQCFTRTMVSRWHSAQLPNPKMSIENCVHLLLL